MRKLFYFLIFLFLSNVTLAEEGTDNGFYAQGGITFGTFRKNNSNEYSEKFSGDSYGLQLFGGYRFADRYGVSGGFYNFSGNYDISKETCTSQFNSKVDCVKELETSVFAPALQFQYFHRFTRSQLVAKIGATSYQVTSGQNIKADGYEDISEDDEKETSSGYVLGVGLLVGKHHLFEWIMFSKIGSRDEGSLGEYEYSAIGYTFSGFSLF